MRGKSHPKYILLSEDFLFVKYKNGATTLLKDYHEKT